MIPPPITTTRASEGNSFIMSSHLLECPPRLLEARQVLVRVRDIIEVDRRSDLGDHAPHALAKERRAFHGSITAAKLVRQGALEVGLKEEALVLGRERAVGGQAAEIEEGRIEPSIVPVNEPDGPAVVEEVRGE